MREALKLAAMGVTRVRAAAYNCFFGEQRSAGAGGLDYRHRWYGLASTQRAAMRAKNSQIGATTAM